VSEAVASAQPDPSALRAPLAACLAGLRAAIEHARAAADAWSAGGDPHGPLDAADGAVRRARAQTVALRSVLPGHSRRVRLADRAVERAGELVAVVRGLPPADSTDVEETLLIVVERAFGAAERAVRAADGGA